MAHPYERRRTFAIISHPDAGKTTLTEKLPADKVLGWLKNPNTPASRFGLYGLFMGHCGKKEHAKAVRELLDSPDKTYSSGLDGMMASYILQKSSPSN